MSSGAIRGTYRPNGSPKLDKLPVKEMVSVEVEITKDAILKVAPEATQAVAASGATVQLAAMAGPSLQQEMAVQAPTLADRLDRLIDIQQQMLDLMTEKFG